MELTITPRVKQRAKERPTVEARAWARSSLAKPGGGATFPRCARRKEYERRDGA